MTPWGLLWSDWKWRQAWTYSFLWRKHPVVVILAGVGVLSLLWLVVRIII